MHTSFCLRSFSASACFLSHSSLAFRLIAMICSRTSEVTTVLCLDFSESTRCTNQVFLAQQEITQLAVIQRKGRREERKSTCRETLIRLLIKPRILSSTH